MSERRLKSKDDTARFVSMVANRQDWRLHPDPAFLDSLIEGLTINYNRYGYYSCPCRDADGVRKLDADIICPCVYCRPDQEQYGYCFCGLYLTPAFYASGAMPRSIPERRPGDGQRNS